MFIVKHNNNKLFVLWGECYLTAIPVGLSAGHAICPAKSMFTPRTIPTE